MSSMSVVAMDARRVCNVVEQFIDTRLKKDALYKELHNAYARRTDDQQHQLEIQLFVAEQAEKNEFEMLRLCMECYAQRDSSTSSE